MSTDIQLGGQSFSQAEIISAIASSNDGTVVDEKLELILTKLLAIEAKLATFPTTWSLS